MTGHECIPCQVGSYSDSDNAESCTDCVTGYTTPQEGSDKSSQCTGMTLGLGFMN